MKKNSLIQSGIRVAVLGLGVSGRAAVQYLQACGAEVVVSDNRSQEQLLEKEGAFLDNCGVVWEAGGHSLAFLGKADIVFVSPGVPLNLSLLVQLQQQGVRIMGELALAAPALCETVVAITGTNGKTTVTTLVGELLREAGKNVFVGGNIGTPIFEYLLKGPEAEALVLEVSSFQLDTAGGFRPDIALLLNITPDHIDRHGSLADYVRAKMKIFGKQRQADTAIVNGDDPLCRTLANEIGSRVMFFGHGSDCQARIAGNRVILRWQEEEIYDLVGTSLANTTGVLNSAAAIAAARSAGCSPERIRAGLAAFQPLHHRMEAVAEVDGVIYYDDSKATNTGAVLSALAQIGGKVVLIAGGKDKGDDYTLLRKSVKDKARKVILIGEAADLLEKALFGTAPLGRAQSMEEAVQLARAVAEPGDAVLLSPACASFDMFKSYAHRGEVFVAAVERLRAAEAVARAEMR
ncbi:MAG: UDP-N-acetylmuramoyl-L-alanine--D-glutamate ligase [Desulfoprunum sp.]|nr:UDP-N-acetylmuramoyl-L-alanine--D-glutamate ligase [Desulfoprunum sp.]